MYGSQCEQMVAAVEQQYRLTALLFNLLVKADVLRPEYSPAACKMADYGTNWDALVINVRWQTG